MCIDLLYLDTNMRKITKSEIIEVKGTKFNVDLEYYYDEKNDLYFDDIELGNENLRRIINAYQKNKNSSLDSDIKTIEKSAFKRKRK